MQFINSKLKFIHYILIFNIYFYKNIIESIYFKSIEGHNIFF